MKKNLCDAFLVTKFNESFIRTSNFDDFVDAFRPS